MALTSCPECDGQVSDAADRCPHCGYPLKPVPATGGARESISPTEPGWYDDPAGKASYQAYWDGEKWTGRTRPGPGTSPSGSGSPSGRQLTEADIWFSYQGRISVGQYWGRFLLGVIAVFVLAFLIYSSVRLNAADGVLGLVSILAIWPSTALAWKRLQDQDRHGALFLLVLIPLIGAIVWLVFSLQSGTPGPNKHGPKTGYRY